MLSDNSQKMQLFSVAFVALPVNEDTIRKDLTEVERRDLIGRVRQSCEAIQATAPLSKQDGDGDE